MNVRRARGLVAAVVLLAIPAIATAAQDRRPGAPAMPQQAQQAPAPLPTPPGSETTPLTAGQIQLWFEAFTVLQAQDALQLSETQYGKFVTRFKALQKIRRTHQQARSRMLAELRRMTGPDAPAVDEVQLTDRLRALREQEDRGSEEVRRAYDGVDETLDVRQRARFRVFEERMEQQKLEFLMRARQNARALGRKGRGSE